MKTKLIIILSFTWLHFTTHAQSLQNYTPVRNTGITYPSISTTGNAFNTWRNTGTFPQDDNRSDFQDIGFDFWYNGIRYTKISVSTNGFIDFSASTDDGGPTADDFGYQNTAFTNSNPANSTNPAIAPFYDDLTAQGGVDPLGTSIKYSLTGTAPSRTFTVEWINMAVYLNTTPSLNFQVQLIENTGVIKINYGTMTQGTQNFSYSMGLNSATISAVPTLAQLKMLQTVNANTFNNTIQNNLTAMPAANSQYVFTPPVPANPTGGLSFTGVTSSSMTLNWTNWATNEVGYVIYNSDDGVNFNFVTQTASNATSANITGLLPSTSYQWRVYAVTEGCLSSALTGTQSTLSNGNKISNQSGNWSNALIWTPNGVPAAGEDVTIANGHTVTINVSGACNNLTIGQGSAAKLEFGGATARTLNVGNNITINSLASFSVNGGSNTTHTVIAKRNIINNGTLNFNTDANSICQTIFNKSGSQTISGTGTYSFNAITLDMGTTSNNILEVASTNFTATANFLTLSNGIFKLSQTNTSNLTPFTAASTIGQTCGIWLNSNNATINTGAGITLIGKLTITNGTANIGNAADEDILSSGGSITMNGGALNIAGKYYNVGINNLSYFSISNGTVTVPSIGSTNTNYAPFHITGVGSQFNQTGGLIIIPREGGGGAQNYGFTNTGSIGGSVTGGTLQIGSAATPAGQTMILNTSYPIGNLSINSANATASLVTSPLTVIRNVNINSGSLRTTTLDINVGGNWFDAGTFVPGNATVNFNSTSAQTIFKAGGETFNNLTFSNAGVKTFSSAITASIATINSGASVDVGTANNQLTLRSHFLNSGTFNARSGLVFFNGTTSQSIGGTSTTNFFDITLNNNAGAILNNSENLIGTLTLNNGTFNTNAQVFTMVSTATNTARIAQITGSGNIIGNVTVQRFAPGGFTGWTLLGTPITSALTYQDWDDDIYISCPTCPDGSAAGFLSIYTYDETFTGLYDNPASYIPLTGITDPITPNTGYWVYLGTGSVSTTNITLDVTGTVGKFNTPIPLKYTNTGSPADDGWNLITNPYPSPVRWSLLKGATANLDNAIYAYNPDLNAGSGAHATYVNNISSPAVGAGGIGDTIPMGQGFYVHVTGASTITAQETNKVGGNPTFLKVNQSASVASSMPLLRLHLKSVMGHDDETVLYLQSGANDSFDDSYDAYKMRGQDPYAPTLALEKNNVQFQINGVAPITGNFSMPLKALTGYSGTYTISPENISSFPAGACINLYDVFTNTTTNLKTNSYVFTLADTTTVARFRLNITMNPLTINSNVNQPNCAAPTSGEIIAQGANSGPWNYYWKNSIGNTIQTSLNKSTADTLKNLSGSTFTVEVNTVGMCDNNTTGFAINNIMLPVSQFMCEDTTYISAGALITCTNTSSSASSYYWDFGDGLGFSSAMNPTYNYSSPGIYTVTLISTSSTGCNDTTTQIVVVSNAITTGINNLANASGLLIKTIRTNEFVLEKNLDVEKECSFTLYDELGRLLINYGKITTRKIYLPLDLKEYSHGIYFLHISINGEPEVIKLPVQ